MLFRSGSYCNKYVAFPIESVIIDQQLIEQESDGDSQLSVYLYVVLPVGVARSLSRETDYVVPQNTLKEIISKNSKTIGAIVRDAVHITLTSDSIFWKQLATSLLVIILLLGTIVFVAMIFTKIYKELQKVKEKNRIYPMEMSIRPPTVRTHPSTITSMSSVSCSNMMIGNNFTPPSTSTGPHNRSPDSCSMINVSEGASSTIGHFSRTGSGGNPQSRWSRRSILRRLMILSARRDRAPSIVTTNSSTT